jgi:hypothetical protein
VIAAETGDFDGNGMRDISTDALAIWLLNGLQVVQSGSPATVPTNWQIVGIGDVDGDGRADILWRDGGTGTLAIWRMNGLQVLQAASLGVVPGNWIVALTGAFNGDGLSDILWRDTASGVAAIWFMSGLPSRPVFSSSKPRTSRRCGPPRISPSTVTAQGPSCP